MKMDKGWRWPKGSGDAAKCGEDFFKLMFTKVVHRKQSPNVSY